MAPEKQSERLERCRQAVEENPDQPTGYYNLGLAYTVSGRVKQAEEAYLKAVELDPTFIKAWVNLGGVRLLHWDFEGCLEANQAAARLDENLTEVHFNMGQAYLYLNNPQGLFDCMKKVLELDAGHAAAHYYSAVGTLALGNLGAAKRHLGRAIELGHSPTQDFIKALEKAEMKRARETPTLIEISGAKSPDENKED